MSDFQVKIKLPAIFIDFSASYSHVNKLNGVQYMLLTMASTDSFRRSTWGEVMDRLGIPEIVFDQLFKPNLDSMINLKMIEPTERIVYGDYIEYTKLTDLGKQAFKKGVIAENVKRFEGTVAYRPGSANDKYVKSSAVTYCGREDFKEDRYSDIEPDELLVENHISKNRMNYGVDQKDAEIFNLEMQKQPSLHCYESPIRLSLDATTGHFTFIPGSLDDNFIKSRLYFK